MPAGWISMALFALAGAISPGPVHVIASSQGARHGFWRALPHVRARLLWLRGLLGGAGHADPPVQKAPRHHPENYQGDLRSVPAHA